MKEISGAAHLEAVERMKVIWHHMEKLAKETHDEARIALL